MVLYLLSCDRPWSSWSCRASWLRRLPSLLWWRRKSEQKRGGGFSLCSHENHSSLRRLGTTREMDYHWSWLAADLARIATQHQNLYHGHLCNSARHLISKDSIPLPCCTPPSPQSQSQSIRCRHNEIVWIKCQGQQQRACDVIRGTTNEGP